MEDGHQSTASGSGSAFDIGLEAKPKKWWQ